MARFRNEVLLRLRLEDEGEHNRTQEAGAEELGVSARTYRRYEAGEVNADGFDPDGTYARRFLKRCAAFFGVSEESLVERTPPPAERPAANRLLALWRLRLPGLLAADPTYLRAPREVPLQVARDGQPPQSLATLAAGGGRFVVLGEAGAGKTTAVRQAVTTLAQDGRARLPVWLELPRLGASLPLFPQAVAALGPALDGVDRPALEAALEAAAGAGQLALFFDAFDEIAPTAEVERLRALRYWADAWPQVTCVVLSRPAADPTESLGFERVHLCGLNPAEQKEVLEARLDSGPQAERLLRQAEAAGLGPLVQNPLMLGLLALLDGEVVDARRLLSRALDVLLVRGAPGGGRGVKEPVGARHLLRRLALQLHGAPGEQWSQETLASLLMEAMEADLQGQLHLRMAWGGVTGFLEDVARNGAVLAPAAQGEWRFLHRALREALVAEALAVDRLAAARARRLLADAERDGLRTQISRWRPVLDLLAAQEPS